ncbi:unnamed protein product [Ambrosiozyma monospora]|uniref:Unnamed protein product n=1 Tax=Ambrosiozyma monospora TaxID=43982 RepID=A0A9W6YYR7_AMBMO|nr:unnamed protein product [Ambrosiozyma monospora]
MTPIQLPEEHENKEIVKTNDNLNSFTQKLIDVLYIPRIYTIPIQISALVVVNHLCYASSMSNMGCPDIMMCACFTSICLSLVFSGLGIFFKTVVCNLVVGLSTLTAFTLCFTRTMQVFQLQETTIETWTLVCLLMVTALEVNLIDLYTVVQEAPSYIQLPTIKTESVDYYHVYSRDIEDELGDDSMLWIWFSILASVASIPIPFVLFCLYFEMQESMYTHLDYSVLCYCGLDASVVGAMWRLWVMCSDNKYQHFAVLAYSLFPLAITFTLSILLNANEDLAHNWKSIVGACLTLISVVFNMFSIEFIPDRDAAISVFN